MALGLSKLLASCASSVQRAGRFICLFKVAARRVTGRALCCRVFMSHNQQCCVSCRRISFFAHNQHVHAWKAQTAAILETRALVAVGAGYVIKSIEALCAKQPGKVLAGANATLRDWRAVLGEQA